jgi:Zn-dependent protease with chaperone function
MPSHPEPSLDAGITALKQGDYQTAKIILRAVVAKEGDRLVGLQAQIGLVVAYVRSGEVAEAIILSETLTQSRNQQVQEWAKRSLEQLLKRPPQQEQTTHQDTDISNSLSVPPLPSYPKNPVSQIYWRQAKRAKVWQPLHKLNLLLFRLLVVGTFLALFWVMRELVILVEAFINSILIKLPFLPPIQLLYASPDLFILAVLVLLICLSPWLLDWMLTNFYGQEPLSKEKLNIHSRETLRLLQRFCQQQGWQLPHLKVLPMSAPVALTYGNLPHTARIVVSQGLLEQLAEDEIATIYALEMGHIAHWDFVVMSLILLFTIPVYRLYQQFSHWGDTRSKQIWRLAMGIMASLAYVVWQLLTGTALWLSQLRLYYSDRLATGLTGNPNGLVRALLKIAIGIANDIQKEEHTSWQLESLNIVSPVGYQQSICLGSVASHTTFESFLMWDYLNPYRWWFIINNTHPLIGDRLQRLSSIADYWHLEKEVYLNQQPVWVKRQSFFLQIAPFVGIVLGVVFACLIWLVWQIAFALKLLNLKWIYDNWSFVAGCLLIGLSIGILIRINSLFPEIKSATVQNEEELLSLLANPASLPIDSISVCIRGKLLGRRGTSNSLGQDLLLQSSVGLVKLHHISWLGQQMLPEDWIGRQIIVTGWLRRGATPWIDIQTLQTQSGQTINSPHPIWSTFLAVATEAWGAYILLKG